MGHGCGHHDAPTTARLRRVLFIALVINGGMFGVEISAGLAAQSVALQADALDFLGDAATYGITLFVLAMSLRWRAAAALLKGVSMGLFGVFVLGAALYHTIGGTLPGAGIMGSVGFAALIANVICALMLIGFREGDANMRSVWLCSRNDAIGNVAVMAAAAGVFATDTGWPDVGVAALMATLAFTSSWQVIRQALRELRAAPMMPVSG
jgi:Co/Zn/Cd efflux system component